MEQLLWLAIILTLYSVQLCIDVAKYYRIAEYTT